MGYRTHFTTRVYKHKTKTGEHRWGEAASRCSKTVHEGGGEDVDLATK